VANGALVRIPHLLTNGGAGAISPALYPQGEHRDTGIPAIPLSEIC